MILVRRALLLAAGVLLAGLAIREAAVLAFVGPHPTLASAVWPNHPSVALDRGLRAIGQSVAAGRAPPPAVTSELRAISRRDPLNPGPLLVEGTNAFAAGDLPHAERLLTTASRLDPLAPAPRFLLAQLFFAQNRGAEGLGQVSFLFDRLNGDAAPLVPALAQFAGQPRNALQLKGLLDAQPSVRAQVLTLLAEDPANLPTILRLAPRVATKDDLPWRQRLLASLVDKGQFARAYALWQSFGGVREPAASGIYNPRFLAGGPLPPFNWRLSSSPSGTAEPKPGGGLHILYFGREDTSLADQLLLLKPGRYRLDFAVQGEAPGLLWILTCLPGIDRQEAPLAQKSFTFTVPPTNCPAQRLELRGAMGDYPMTLDLTLSPVILRSEARS